MSAQTIRHIGSHPFTWAVVSAVIVISFRAVIGLGDLLSTTGATQAARAYKTFIVGSKLVMAGLGALYKAVMERCQQNQAAEMLALVVVFVALLLLFGLTASWEYHSSKPGSQHRLVSFLGCSALGVTGFLLAHASKAWW